MSDAPPTVLAVAHSEDRVAISTSERRVRWFEVGLVLLVACGGYVLNSLYLLIHGPGASPGITNVRWVSAIAQEIASLLLLGYVLWRRGRRFADLGLRWSLRDVGAGLLVTGLSYAAYVMGALLIQVIHRGIYGSFAHGTAGKDFFAHPSAAMIPFSLLTPFFEELIVRAYLMTEVMQLSGSAVLAVVLSVFVQSSYHLYYGWTTALSLSFSFLVLAIYYGLFRKALPIIVAHGFFDISALIRIW